MTALLPIIDELASAPDHVSRAHWLLAAPLAVLARDLAQVRPLLEAAGFREGLAYLDFEVAVLSAVRGPDGLPPIAISMMRDRARVGVQVIARGCAGEGGANDAR